MSLALPDSPPFESLELLSRAKVKSFLLLSFSVTSMTRESAAADFTVPEARFSLAAAGLAAHGCCLAGAWAGFSWAATRARDAKTKRADTAIEHNFLPILWVHLLSDTRYRDACQRGCQHSGYLTAPPQSVKFFPEESALPRHRKEIDSPKAAVLLKGELLGAREMSRQ